jgi:ankyrin repeat protein
MGATGLSGYPEERLLEAVRAGDAERVGQLLDAAPELAKAREPDGASAVLLAVYCGHPEIVVLFEERGLALDLFEASAVGRPERVAALLDHTPYLVHGFSGDGYPALGLAVFFGHDAVAALLLERGADVNTASKNSQRVTPLHAAVACRNATMARELLVRGADPDAVQAAGFTPLDSAAFHGDREIVELLLSYGANPRHKTDEGKTAADLAGERGHTELAAMLAGLAA